MVATVTLTLNGQTFTGTGQTRLEALASAQPVDAETAAAEAFAQADAAVQRARQDGAAAAAAGNWAAYFAACAAEAQALNRRAAILDAACCLTTHEEEGPARVA